MKFAWRDEYSIGNSELDGQHRKWMELFNRLEDVMLNERHDQMRQARKDVLREMSEYVDYHFRFEEEYMKEIGYPHADKHWRMHKDFRNRIYTLCREHEEGAVVLNSEVMKTISEWFLDHILKQDVKIMHHLRESGKGREG